MGFNLRNYNYDIQNLIDDECADVRADMESAVDNVLSDYFNYSFFDRLEEILEQAFDDGYAEAEEECRTLCYDEAYEKGVEETINAISEGLKDFVYEKLGLKKPVEEVSPEVQIENAIAENETL